MTKKISLILGLLLCVTFAGIAYGAMDIQIMINGKTFASDVPPVVVDNRVMVPLRAMSEFWGADVMWNAETMTVEITGPVKKFTSSFMEKGGYVKTGAEAAQLMAMGNVVVLDVRPQELRDMGYIKDSLYVPLTTIPDTMDKDKFSKEKTYLVYCASDINAAYATAILNMDGYQAFVIPGGMQSLIDNGFESVTP